MSFAVLNASWLPAVTKTFTFDGGFGTSSPFGGLAGVIFVAFIGAVVLLFLLRLLRTATRR